MSFFEKALDIGEEIRYNGNRSAEGTPIYGRLAQLVEHPLDVRRVSGSSPLSSTKAHSLASEKRRGCCFTKALCNGSTVVRPAAEAIPWYHLKDIVFSSSL